MSFPQVICLQYSDKLKWSLPSSVCPGAGFRLHSCVDAASCPALNGSSRIHLELIAVSYSASPLAVTVGVTPPVYQYILLRPDCGICYFIPSKFSRQ